MSKNLTIKWVDTIDSTNLQALREANIAPEGSVWIADFQTAGRGQRGNKWESVKGKNLTFTILFKPEFLHVSKQFSISEIVALGVCKYLINKGLTAKIKWPNDIYVGDKKICGILIEHSICGDKLSVSIAGIGLNLNQIIFDSAAPNPISLLLLIGSSIEFDRKKELNLLLTYIFNLYEELKMGNEIKIKKEYMSLLYRFNEFHKFIEIDSSAPANMPIEQITAGVEIEAQIIGVDENACLVLKHKAGIVKSYAFKEIKYII
ncbi:MAG: biotin--[acetyl-CoA-carboxylase] ligase [Bacteroidales bacterium]